MPFSMLSNHLSQNSAQTNQFFQNHHHAHKSIFKTSRRFFNFVTRISSANSFLRCSASLYKTLSKELWWFSIKHFNVSSSLLCASSSCHTNYICPWEFYFIRIKTNFNSHHLSIVLFYTRVFEGEQKLVFDSASLNFSEF